MASRFYNPAPVFMDLLGLEPLAGGSLQFYDIGTTTPKNTWSDADLNFVNPNPVPLDSSGRSNVNIWLDGAYSVVCRAADNSVVFTRDVNSGDGAGATIPPLVVNEFLTNDGANLVWAPVLQVPDPSDSANDILSTDGANLIWIPQQSLPNLPIENGTGRVKIGTMMIQWGSSSLPASGQTVTSGSVNFPFPFSGAPVVIPTANSNAVAAEGQIPVLAVTSQDANGFAVVGNTDDYTRNGSRITSAVPFSWIAVGPVAAD